MKKMKKRSNGFTLTELAIVIAVIAILIAVLVPTFVSLINSANESSDKQLVKNINTALSVDEAINGDVNTMSDALAVAAENGYNVDKLTPSSSGDIVWDQDSNRFLLINEEGEIVYYDSSVTSASITETKYKLWYIAQSSSDLGGDYSYYLNYTVADGELLTVTTGVDVGKNEGVDVLYVTDSEQNVIINTNGGQLTVTAANSSVAHYGTTNSVIVNNVKSESYHLYGTISGNLYVYGGRVVAESGSSVSSIIAKATNTTAITVVTSSSASVGSIKTNGSVTVDSNVEATALTDAELEITNYFAGGDGTTVETAYQISSEEELRAISVLDMSSTSNYYYFKLTKNITLYRTSDSDYIVDYFNGVFDGNGYSISVATASGATVNGYDGAGYGSYWFFSYPVKATVKNLTVYQSSGVNIAIANGWYNCNSTLTFDNVDMGSASMSSTTIGMARNASGYIQYFNGAALTFSGCDNYYNLSSDDPSLYSGVYIGGYYSCSLTGYYYKEGSTTLSSGIVGFAAQNITFENCNNYGNITGANVGVFVGNGSYTKPEATTYDKNEHSTYYNSNGVEQNNTYYTYATADDALTVKVSGCSNSGVIYYYISGGLYSQKNNSAEETIASNGCNCTTSTTPISASNLAIKASDGVYTITTTTDSNEYTYKILYMGSASWKSSTASGSQYMTLSFEVDVSSATSSGSTVTTEYRSGVKFYDLDSYVTAKQSGNTTWKDSVKWTEFSQVNGCYYYYDEANNCYVFDYSELNNGYTYTMNCSDTTVYVSVYDASNNLKGVTKAS